jgi:TonB family protein
MASILAGITTVFAIAWCAASLLDRASAASRHVVWTCAFAAVLLLAPLRWCLPHRAIAPAATVITAITATTVPIAPRSTDSPSFDSTNMLLALWAAGTLVMTLRLLSNAFHLRSIVRSARGKRPILVSPGIRSPLVTGLLRPVILLPDTSAGWTLARRRAVLAHEAAHIRRHDPAILFAAHIATALYWFHPICWLAAARLRAESERACDDAALGGGLTPSDYAGHLLDLARKFNPQLAIPMATTSHLESRVKSILDPATNRSFPARTVWFAAAALTVATLAPLTTLTLRAQQAAAGTAAITGTVTDPTGAVVPRVSLTASNSDVSYEVSATSNSSGVYSFANLPGGHYTIEASAPGFARFHLANLTLVNGGQMQIDPRLALGKINMTTEVAAQGQAKPQAAVASASGQPIRVGGNVQAAKLIQRVDPVYPADLRAQGVEGTVVLQATISKDGIPQSITLQNTGANPEFVSAAMAAFSQWRFKPTQLNGEPVEGLATNQFDFKLIGQAPVIDDRLFPRK